MELLEVPSVRNQTHNMGLLSSQPEFHFLWKVPFISLSILSFTWFGVTAEIIGLCRHVVHIDLCRMISWCWRLLRESPSPQNELSLDTPGRFCYLQLSLPISGLTPSGGTAGCWYLHPCQDIPLSWNSLLLLCVTCVQGNAINTHCYPNRFYSWMELASRVPHFCFAIVFISVVYILFVVLKHTIWFYWALMHLKCCAAISAISRTYLTLQKKL